MPACISHKKKNKKEKETEETEDEKKPSKKPSSNADELEYLSLQAPKSYESLKDADLGGLWVDEHGAAFIIDDEYDILIDSNGDSYDIIEYLDDGIKIAVSGDILPEILSYSKTLPIPSVFKLPMYLSNDGVISCGAYKAVRGDSPEGQQMMKAVMDNISDIDLKIMDFYGDETICFHSDGTASSEYDEYGTWSIDDDGFIVMIEDDGWSDEDRAVIRELGDSMWLACDVDYYESMVLLDSSSDDGCLALAGDFIRCPVEGDIEAWKVTPDGSVSVCKNLYTNEYEENCHEFNEYDVYYWVLDDDKNSEYMIFGSMLIGYCEIDTMGFEVDFDFYFRRDSILAQMILYYLDITSGRMDNIILNDISEETVVYSKEDEVITLDLSAYMDLAWYPEEISYENDSSVYYLSDESRGEKVLSNIEIDYKDNSSKKTKITFEISNVDDEYIDCINLYYSDTAYSAWDFDDLTLIDKSKYSLTVDGDKVTVVVEADKSGAYIVGASNEEIKILNTYYYYDLIIAMDPEESLWAKTCNTGDIISLVDMDYIEESVDKYSDTIVFWVSTPEELASAYYYINTLDVYYGECYTNFYIYLEKDIDLTGYEWASLGYYGNEGYTFNNRLIYDNVVSIEKVEANRSRAYQHYFQGIIVGNGFSIKGLNIPEGPGNSSFIQRGHVATIIGLTLEDPTVPSEWVFVDDASCIIEFFDCHVVYTESRDSYPEFSYGGNIDCSETKNGKETALSSDDYQTELYSSSDNWLRRYYQTDNGDYKYDFKTILAAYMTDPDEIIELNIYLGKNKYCQWADAYEQYYLEDTDETATLFGFIDF